MSGDIPEGPPDADQMASGWEAVMEDMESTAEAYRDRGWTTLEIHPGDSVLVDSESRTGLDVVVSGPEYEELEALTDEVTFTDVEVFCAESSGLFYLLVVEQSLEDETAVFVPTYYDPATSEGKLDTIREDGELSLFCRRLDNEYVEFVHEDIEPFLPEALKNE
jgi:hypothetical protein